MTSNKERKTNQKKFMKPNNFATLLQLCLGIDCINHLYLLNNDIHSSILHRRSIISFACCRKTISRSMVKMPVIL